MTIKDRFERNELILQGTTRHAIDSITIASIPYRSKELLLQATITNSDGDFLEEICLVIPGVWHTNLKRSLWERIKKNFGQKNQMIETRDITIKPVVSGPFHIKWALYVLNA